MNYEEMVKEAYESIMGEFDKEAANRFSKVTSYEGKELPFGVAQRYLAHSELRPEKYIPGDLSAPFNTSFSRQMDAAPAHAKTIADFKAGKATIDDLKRTGRAFKEATRDMLNAGRQYKEIYPGKPLTKELQMRNAKDHIHSNGTPISPNFSRGKVGKTLADIKAGAAAKLGMKTAAYKEITGELEKEASTALDRHVLRGGLQHDPYVRENVLNKISIGQQRAQKHGVIRGASGAPMPWADATNQAKRSAHVVKLSTEGKSGPSLLQIKRSAMDKVSDNVGMKNGFSAAIDFKNKARRFQGI